MSILRLLCTIVKSDISGSLKTFRNFLRASKRDIVSSVIDITAVIGEYETLLNERTFIKVQRHVIEEVDKFFVEIFFLKIVHNKESVVKLNTIFENIESSFPIFTKHEQTTDITHSAYCFVFLQKHLGIFFGLSKAYFSAVVPENDSLKQKLETLYDDD